MVAKVGFNRFSTHFLACTQGDILLVVTVFKHGLGRPVLCQVLLSVDLHPVPLSLPCHAARTLHPLPEPLHGWAKLRLRLMPKTIGTRANGSRRNGFGRRIVVSSIERIDGSLVVASPVP